MGSASVTIGGSTALDVITASHHAARAINGERLRGRAVARALFLSVLSTALDLMIVNIYWQNFATGAILIFAILLDALIEKRKSIGKAIA